MRLVIDTNVLISALLVQGSLPAHLLALWREKRFELMSAPEQFDELMRVTRYPKIRERLTPALAGRLVNELRQLTVVFPKLPEVTVCTDPSDNYLLALAQAAQADFIVTGDKRDVLALQVFQGTRIVTVRAFLTDIGRMP